LTLTCVRIFDEALTVPDKLANIEFIVENPGAAPPIPMDGRGAPICSTRADDPFLVQDSGDGTRALATSEFRENPNDNRSLFQIDAALTCRESTVRPKSTLHSIAVRQTSS